MLCREHTDASSTLQVRRFSHAYEAGIMLATAVPGQAQWALPCVQQTTGKVPAWITARQLVEVLILSKARTLADLRAQGEATAERQMQLPERKSAVSYITRMRAAVPPLVTAKRGFKRLLSSRPVARRKPASVCPGQLGTEAAQQALPLGQNHQELLADSDACASAQHSPSTAAAHLTASNQPSDLVSSSPANQRHHLRLVPLGQRAQALPQLPHALSRVVFATTVTTQYPPPGPMREGVDTDVLQRGALGPVIGDTDETGLEAPELDPALNGLSSVPTGRRQLTLLLSPLPAQGELQSTCEGSWGRPDVDCEPVRDTGLEARMRWRHAARLASAYAAPAQQLPQLMQVIRRGLRDPIARAQHPFLSGLAKVR